jgi:NAD+ kinase
MSAVGFLLHPTAPDVAAARAHVEALGFSTWSTVRDVADEIARHGPETALLVTVGGDGTFLLGARLAAPLGIPVMGVNRGRLGFLTDVEAEQLERALSMFAVGEHRVLERSMLDAAVDDGPRVVALNEVVIRSPEVVSARIRVHVEGVVLGDFDADGMVVATATGSTAYALSAGGPPIDPRVQATVLVPLAVHGLDSRALVLPNTADIRLDVVRGSMVAAADGAEWARLGPGSSLSVSPGIILHQVTVEQTAPFVTRLHDKLRFGLPLKRERSADPEDEHAG